MPFVVTDRAGHVKGRGLASMTGVEMTPSGFVPSQPTVPDFAAGVPSFFVQTVAPVASSNALTSFPLVTAMKIPLPPAPPSK